MAQPHHDNPMPLKCLQSGVELYAFDIQSNLEWEGLRDQNARTPTLSLTCCGSPVLLRMSKLGTRHFVHARRNGCAKAPETAIHLLAKERIAAGIRRAGWTAKIEEEGKTPDGEICVADVLAIREGERTLAFEVQWSWQGQDETRMRQSRYESAKIVGFWFFRQHDFQSDQSMPAFRLDFNKTSSEFEVLIPSYECDPSKDRRKSKFSQFWRQSVELSAFVEGALNGRPQFAPALNRKFEVEVSTAPTVCNACSRRIRILAGLKFAVQKELPGFSDISVPIYNLPGSSKTAELLSSIVSHTALQRHGVGKIVSGQQCIGLLNSCLYCGHPVGNSEALRLLNVSQPMLHCSVFLNLDWASRVDSADFFRWWFDDRPSSTFGISLEPKTRQH